MKTNFDQTQPQATTWDFTGNTSAQQPAAAIPTEGSIYCANCGQQLPASSKFCSKCGQSTVPAAAAAPQPMAAVRPAGKLSGGAKAWIIICIVVNAIVGFVAFGMSTSPDASQLLVLSGILSFAVVTGYSILLASKKLGFYIVCGCVVVAIIINLATGNFAQVLVGVLNPTITWLLVRNLWSKAPAAVAAVSAMQPRAVQPSVPVMQPAARTFAPYTGTGVCDVCNGPLTGKRAYIVPNAVFYNSPEWRKFFVQTQCQLMGENTAVMGEMMIRQMQQRDKSPGSAVCEDCIHMF